MCVSVRICMLNRISSGAKRSQVRLKMAKVFIICHAVSYKMSNETAQEAVLPALSVVATDDDLINEHLL